MRLIGLCGRSGCGKSFFCNIAAREGFKIIDCDKVYWDLVSYRSRCLVEIEQAFGSEIIENDMLNRRVLAPIVFSNPEKLKLLNDITHKHILAKIDELISQFNENDIVILDAPTLFESGLNKKCHKIIGVVANDDVAVSRIMARDNISRSEAASRLANQKPFEFFLENCDHVIYNESSVEEFEESSLKVINDLKGEFL